MAGSSSRKKNWKVRGDQIHIHAYIPLGMFEAIQKFRDPTINRWESALVRRIIHEWLEIKEVAWKKEEQGKSTGR